MYTVYKTTNQINGKWYIGVHRTDNPMDGYLGSGGDRRKQGLAGAIKKYGHENFTKEILCIFDDVEMAYFIEARYVTMREVYDPMCYNLTPGGNIPPKINWTADKRKEQSKKFSGRVHSDETKYKMRESWKKRPPMTEETKRRLSVARKKRAPMTEETRSKISESMKGNTNFKPKNGLMMPNTGE